MSAKSVDFKAEMEANNFTENQTNHYVEIKKDCISCSNDK